MPSVIENQVRWTDHPWEREGHEWSPGGTPAGGELLWWRAILPRIHAHVPTGSALELGPGFGRWTHHLLRLSTHLTIVDLTERCIEYCRRRFADAPHVECWTNDGRSLDMVADGSIDFVFSFDSLVHAEAPVVREYLAQLARKLKPGGTGFIHHSNLRGLAGSNDAIPSWVARRNWRGESMSARLFREYCRDAGLHCTTQEVINWVSRSRRADRHRIPGWGMPLTDTMSTFMRPPVGAEPAPTLVYVNPGFVEEWRQLVTLATVYAQGRVDRPDPAPSRVRANALARLTRVAGREGIAAVAGRLQSRAAKRADHVTSLVRERARAHRVWRHDPVTGSLRGGLCPACGARLAQDRCERCVVEYVLG
jgi:SAM-dependent methyltransferase